MNQKYLTRSSRFRKDLTTGLSSGQTVANFSCVNPTEALFKTVATIQEHVEISGIIRIACQRGVRKHRIQTFGAQVKKRFHQGAVIPIWFKLTARYV